jgi:hypothetical protein
MAHGSGTCWFDSAAEQILFEREARRSRTRFARTMLSAADGRAPRRLRYTIPFEVPAYDDPRMAVVEFSAGARSQRPSVYLDGPECRRHRYLDGSLCMWLESDPPQARWLLTDGLYGLLGHITEHAYCEARCRDGAEWLKPEAPGRHPRPSDCPSCSSRR